MSLWLYDKHLTIRSTYLTHMKTFAEPVLLLVTPDPMTFNPLGKVLFSLVKMGPYRAPAHS